ncbi:MAG: radical SAM protein [Candidatus Helarchaeota archaeon]|nr:radical SAM protein [Candidatus Helarchaeota archaeon]
MYDPIELSTKIESHVIKNRVQKKYYRFRGAKYYGGISTADVVGCNMYCHFCWVNPKVRHRYQTVGKFYGPEEVGERLVQIAKKAKFNRLRVSGGEPTIGEEHLIALLSSLDDFPYPFILETNGMLLSQESYVKNLVNFNNLYVRVALKAATPEIFSKVTGAVPAAYHYPLQALNLLIQNEIPCHASIIIDFCTQEDLKCLADQLKEISPDLVGQLEFESLILYPHVVKGLKKIGLQF